jgi:DNA-binding helix-hairpin-helix protein with protein kinase domain
MTTLLYRGINNIQYTSGQKIGQGGEGSVYEIKGSDSIVIKVYNEPLESDKKEKLKHMASIANGELTKFAAWPIDVIYDRLDNLCGFVMKRLDSYVPLHKLYSPLERKKLFPDKGYKFLIHVAKNLAMAFHKIHEFGIVIGDVNEANILVNRDGLVAFIDCDSFQIRNGNRYYFCEVGVARYTPPELLEKGSFNNVIRTTNTDSFSLATLIFQLLFLGKAPFTGINLTTEDIDEEKAIRTKEFAYSLRRTNKKLQPAKNSLQLKYFTSGIIDFFHSAFETIDSRPSARQWVYELDILGKDLISCSNSTIHQYSKTMQQCPWCFFRDNAGIVYFLDDSYLKSNINLNNIEQFVNGFKFEKLEIKKLTENYLVGNLTAAPIERKFSKLKNMNKTVIGILILVTLIACIFFSWGYSILGIIAALIFNTASPAQKKLNTELTNRKLQFDNLKGAFQKVIKQHNNLSEFSAYTQCVNKLAKYINTFRNLPSEFINEKKKIEEKNYNIKYNSFLQQFDVLYYPIQSFGATKKRLIYNNGIRTAADVQKLNSIKINGIGPANIQILLNWQRQVGAGFTYSPDINAINNDIKIAVNSIAIKKQRLEVDIKSEYNSMMALKANILTSTKALEKQYEELKIKLYQSELDLKAFQILMMKKI